MRVERKSVFETNSSSSHSLVIGRNRKGTYDTNFKNYMNTQGKVFLVFGADYNFGWGYAEYTDAYAKLNYLACIAFETNLQMLYKRNRNIKKIENILNLPDMVRLDKAMFARVKGFTGFSMSKDYIYESEYQNVKELHLHDSVDHQSWEDFCDTGIEGFLKMHKITLENFLFNPHVKLIIDNDNIEY